MKKTLTIAGILLLLILGIGLYFINKNIFPLFAEDTLTVKAMNPLIVNKIKIESGFNSLNRKSDLVLFENRERYSVFYDGEVKDSLKTQYGENDFLVTYNEEFYISFRQFKMWNKSRHHYNFEIYLEDSIPNLKMDIEGDNEMRFDVPMIPISLAHQYVVNTPIDSAGIVYDFFKLTKPTISDEQQEKNKKDEEELIKRIHKLF